MTANEKPDTRRSERHRQSNAILWRTTGAADYRVGQLLESSATGFAFTWRGRHLPREGTILECHTRTRLEPLLPERAIVKRVNHVHDDLAVIAVERWQRHRPELTSNVEAKALALSHRRRVLRGVLAQMASAQREPAEVAA